jgi:superfamily II DNA or RNA helicase
VIEIIVTSQLTVGFEELTQKEWDKLRNALTFELNGDLVISYRRLVTRGCYKLPRGVWSMLPNRIIYHDRRSCPEMPKLNFIVQLDDVEKDIRFAGQSDAVRAMFENEQGLLIRPPGTGKTAIGLAFAASCGTRTLVLVHTEDILQQWVTAAKEAIPGADVGIVRGKEARIGHITIATVQTLFRKFQYKPKDWWRQFGCIIADEAHHVSAPTWETILNICPAKYRFGFTASETRADGMHPTMRFIIGPVIHKQKFTSSVDLQVVPVKTGFRVLYRGAHDWMPLLTKLTEDDARNRRIAEIVNREAGEGNTILVLSRRIDHLGGIASHLTEPYEILTGKRTRADRIRILEEFRAGTVRCLLATQLADEALDVPRLNRVVLTFPGKHEGRIIQQIGRALRTHSEKEDAKIYDVVDNVGVLRHQWNQRKRTYKKNGISIKGGIGQWL